MDPLVAGVILRMERSFESTLAAVEKRVAHLPSRVRSLLWILCSLPIMAEHGHTIAAEAEVCAELYARLPILIPEALQPAAAMA